MKSKPQCFQVFLIAAILGVTAKGQDFSDPADILRYQAQSKPLEWDGTIRSFTTNKPGWYFVAMDGVNGKRLSILLTPATKFWEHDQALDSAKAYAKLTDGQKVRLLHKPAFDEALHRTWACDLMFVDQWGAGGGTSTPNAGGGKPPAGDPLKSLQDLQKLVPNGGGSLVPGTGQAMTVPGDGWYYLQSEASHLNLDVANANRENGGRVCQAKPNKAQVWRFIPAGNGSVFIQSNVSGLNLDVVGRNKNDGGDVCQAKQDAAQVWNLIPADNGTCLIQSKISGLFLAADHANHDVGGRVCQVRKEAAQPWRLIPEPHPDKAPAL